MRAYQNVDGGFTFGVHEYDIAKTTAIKAGQVVKLSEGLVVAATAAETGAILGVAKENHSGAEDAINPRSNGTKILGHDHALQGTGDGRDQRQRDDLCQH